MNLFCYRKLLLLLIIFTIRIAYASDEIPESFKGYKQINFHSGKEMVRSESLIYGSIYIDPQIKYQLEKYPPKIIEGGFDLKDTGLSVVFKIKDVDIGIRYTPGMSVDPTYLIKIARKEFEVVGQRLFVSSAGDFYVDGKIDHMFNAKRKYSIVGGLLAEVQQPLYWVDLVCEVNEQLILTSERCGNGDKVAVIPSGVKVNVLLAESTGGYDNFSKKKARFCKSEKGDSTESFLVATPFGLVGWAQTRAGGISEEHPGKPISCIKYWGD